MAEVYDDFVLRVLVGPFEVRIIVVGKAVVVPFVAVGGMTLGWCGL